MAGREKDGQDLLQRLGRVLRQARQLRAMTQAQVARRAGIDVRCYSRIELGRINVTYSTLTSVARALKVFPPLLLFSVEQTQPETALEIMESITHLLATHQSDKIAQLSDFLHHVLNARCNCPSGHCLTLRMIRDRSRSPSRQAERGSATRRSRRVRR